MTAVPLRPTHSGPPGIGPAGGPALLAIAHGSADPRHAEAVELLAAAVRRERPGRHVAVAHLDHCGPSTSETLAALVRSGVREVVALPLLLTSAYHVKHDIPAAVRDSLDALGPARRRVRVTTAAALGPDPLLVSALEYRLRERGLWPGDPETAVVLASAGSTDPVALAGIEATATAWKRAGWHAVVTAYASARRPTAGEVVSHLRFLGARQIAVAPYFIAPGYLLDRVVDDALAAGADAVAEPLADAPDLARLVLRRYDAAVTARARRSA